MSSTNIVPVSDVHDVEAALAFAAARLHARVETVDGISVILTPTGAQSIKVLVDEWDEFPERAIGSANLTTEAAFAAHVLRQKSASSVVFADDTRQAPKLVAVYDYHDEQTAGRLGQPRHLGHRARYAPALSDEWVGWNRQAGAGFVDAAAFAEFVESNILDVVAAPSQSETLIQLRDVLGGEWATPSQLMELSRGLQLSISETVKSGTRLSSGEIQVQFEQKHADGSGGDLRVPTLFAVGIPVFRDGPRYQIAMRLRYRVHAGKVSWAIAPHRMDAAWDHAFAEILTRLAEVTAIPMFRGTPDA